MSYQFRALTDERTVPEILKSIRETAGKLRAGRSIGLGKTKSDFPLLGGGRRLNKDSLQIIARELDIEPDGHLKSHYMAAILDEADVEYDPLEVDSHFTKEQLLAIEDLLEETLAEQEEDD